MRFNCFQDGTIMAWVSNQTNKPSYYAYYTDKHPIWRNETTRKIPFVTKKNERPLLQRKKWVIRKSIRN